MFAKLSARFAHGFAHGAAGRLAGRLTSLGAACGLDRESLGLRAAPEPRGKRKPVRLDFEQLEKRWLPAAAFDFSSATYSVDEDGASVIVTVTLTDPNPGLATVQYATSDGTATAGADYDSASGTLNYAFGATSRTFTIFITDDQLSESNETVTLTLSNPTNGSLGTITTATLTINNVTPSGWGFTAHYRTTDLEQGYFYPFANAQVALQTNDLFVAHGFDYRRSLMDPAHEAWSSAAGMPALLYRSQTAYTRPILEGVLAAEGAGHSINGIEARLTWNGGSPQDWVAFTQPPPVLGDWLYGLMADYPVNSSGLYSFQIDLKIDFSGRGDILRSATGSAYLLVNDDNSALGAGWSLAGLDKLVSVAGGMVWLYGAGGQRFFSGSGGTYTSPANDFGTLVKNVDDTYTYTSPQQIVWQFDTGGKLTRIVDPHNETRTFSYTGADLTKVEEPDGGVTTFSYSGGRLTKIEMPGARTLTVTVDSGSGDLTVLQNPDGALRTFTYDADHLLTNDQFGGQNATFAYDGSTKLLASIHWGGASTVAFDAAAEHGLTTSPGPRVESQHALVTDGLSRAYKIALDSKGRLTSRTDEALLAGQTTETFTRNGAGQLTEHKDRLDRHTTYTYSGPDLTQVQYPDGSFHTFAYDATYRKLTRFQDSLNRVTTLTYTTEGDLRTVRNALNEVTTFTWDASTGLLSGVTDARGNTTDFFYDGSRRLEGIRDPLLHRTTFTYDAAGNVATVKDALLRVTTFAYDKMRRATTATDALAGVTTFAYNARGQATSQIDPLGRTTSWTYDARGLNTAITEAVGSSVQRTTTLAYDAALQLSSIQDARGNFTTFQYNTLGLVTEERNALSERTTFTYDSMGRNTQVKDARGNFVTFTYTSRDWLESVRDQAGNRTTHSYDTEGNRLTTKDALTRVTTFSYDVLNRLESVRDAQNNLTTLTYDAAGNLRSLTDPLNNKTTYSYDAANQRTKITDARNTDTTLVYDEVGNLKNLIDPSNNKTTFVYDSLNRQTQEIDARGKTLTYGYDAVGNVTVAYDRVGRRRDFTYDELNRVKREQWIPSGGGAAVNTLTFTYDLNDNLLTGQDASGTNTFTYDALNRADTSKDLWNKTLTFTYDQAGNRTKVEDSFGGVMTSVYTATNLLENRRLSGIGGAQLRVDFTYNAVLQRETARRYSDISGSTLIGATTFTYDEVNRLTRLEHRSGAGSMLGNYTFTYDAASRLSEEIFNGSSATFGYDTAHQITQGAGVTYGYDASGNRNNSSQSISAGNRLDADLVWTYTYDDEGNLTRRSKGTNAETWDYTYDHRNQMVSAHKKNTQAGSAVWSATYTYDAFGNRVKQELDPDGTGGGSSTTTKFAYDKLDIWADLNEDGTLAKRYLRGDVIDELLANTTSGGTVKWYLVDRMGSVRQMTDSSGAVQNTITYDAFGKITGETNSGFGDRWKWTSREWDSTLGLQFNRWRYYNPETGRWTSEDPVGFAAQDYNLYRPVLNRVTTASDPWGLHYPPRLPHSPGRQKELEDYLERMRKWQPPFVLPDPPRLSVPPRDLVPAPPFPAPPSKRGPQLSVAPPYDGIDLEERKRRIQMELETGGWRQWMPPGEMVDPRSGVRFRGGLAWEYFNGIMPGAGPGGPSPPPSPGR